MPQAKQRIAVIGLGLYGAGVAYALSAFENVEVIGVDQFSPPHAFGSSTGGTRISRFANFENSGNGYVHPAIQTAHMFTELQDRADVSDYIRAKHGSKHLFYPNGITIMGPSDSFSKAAHGENDPLQRTIQVAEKHKDIIDFNVLYGREIRKKFPALLIPDEELDSTSAYYERGSGTIFPERCVDALLFGARKNGATLLTNSRVTHLDAYPIVKKLNLENGDVIEADAVVVCAGPWVNDFMPSDMRIFKVERQVQAWFQNYDPEFTINNYPNYIRFVRTGPNPQDVDYFYGFPANDHYLVKIALERGTLVDPDDRNLREVWDAEARGIYSFSKPYIRGLQDNGMRGSACRYTVPLRDHLFRTILHPESLDTYIVSACSGHGAKHSFALASAIARAVSGRPALENIDLKDYGWKRMPALT